MPQCHKGTVEVGSYLQLIHCRCDVFVHHPLFRCSTTDTIVIVCQLQEKFHTINKTLYKAFVYLEKTFDRVPRHVIWWALHKLGVEQWLVRLIWSMYENARSTVGVGCNLNEELSVKVGVYQGSCISPLLFITVLGALSQGFRAGCAWENLYAYDLVIITESVEELQEKLILCKTNMEGKGLWVNMGKTKVLVWGLGFLTCVRSLSKTSVCLKGLGANSIFCGGCSSWVHYCRCSCVLGPLKPDPNLSPQLRSGVRLDPPLYLRD